MVKRKGSGVKMTIGLRIGQRMRRAAEDADLSNRDVGKALGYTGTVTIARWYLGQNQPAYDDMQRFADLVGRPFSWFFRIDAESDDQAEFLLDVIVSVLYRMLQDESVADALASELGDPAVVPPGTRRLLEDMQDVSRDLLYDLTNGWIELAPAERRRRLRRIVSTYLDPDAL